MLLQLDQQVKIAEDKTGSIYNVSGIDKCSGRIWLTIYNDAGYDGYDGDLIISPTSTYGTTFHVNMKDDRSSMPNKITLVITQPNALTDTKRTLIRVQLSEKRTNYVAMLHLHPTYEVGPDVPFFYADTEGEAAGQVLAWMINAGISVNLLEVAIH